MMSASTLGGVLPVQRVGGSGVKIGLNLNCPEAYNLLLSPKSYTRNRCETLNSEPQRRVP